MNRFDTQRRRLAWVVGAVFVALMGASAALILQSFDRLRLESFNAQRTLAEEVAGRIGRQLQQAMSLEAARPLTDYDFATVSGEPNAALSPLSSLPPQTSLPGVVGYFQVDAAGHFSTPWLPADSDHLNTVKLTAQELEQRRGAQARLRRLLETDEAAPTRDRADPAAAVDKSVNGTPTTAAERAHGSLAGADRDDTAATRGTRELYHQLSNANAAKAGQQTAESRLGKLAELKFEESLANRAKAAGPAKPAAAPSAASAPRAQAADGTAEPALRRAAPRDGAAHRPLAARIPAFHSAVDPPSLALLDNDHLVLYRKVWLKGQRIQGAVVDQRAFDNALIGRTFAESSLSRNSNLVVALDGDVIGLYPAAERETPAQHSAEVGGSLLLRQRLAPPADRVELVFSVAQLPPGPGAVTLTWISVVMALVLCGGCLVLYRLGRVHIRLAEQQQDFVAAVSHELKTPLTSIRMYGEILKAGWADEEKKRTYYDFILSESERLTRLVGNVLQLARITRNSTRRSLRSRCRRPRCSTRSSRRSFPPWPERTSPSIRIDGAGDAPVRVDEDAFMQVMINLVDNAIKFSARAEHRVVELGSRIDGDWVEFRVRDFGPGVARPHMKKIFKLFYRSENELTRETVGTGIGLALVRELTEQMGGRVDVVNREPGAEFRVRLRRESS